MSFTLFTRTWISSREQRFWLFGVLFPIRNDVSYQLLHRTVQWDKTGALWDTSPIMIYLCVFWSSCGMINIDVYGIAQWLWLYDWIVCCFDVALMFTLEISRAWWLVRYFKGTFMHLLCTLCTVNESNLFSFPSAQYELRRCLLPPLWSFLLHLNEHLHSFWEAIHLEMALLGSFIYSVLSPSCLSFTKGILCTHVRGKKGLQPFFSHWLKFIWLNIMKQCCSWSFRSLLSQCVLWKANYFMPPGMCILPPDIWCNICHIALSK